MIDLQQQKRALAALQALLITGRTISLDNALQKNVVDIFDGVEYLVALMIEEDDQTSRFFDYLRELAVAQRCCRALEILNNG